MTAAAKIEQEDRRPRWVLRRECSVTVNVANL
jgi:hypothetical protein